MTKSHHILQQRIHTPLGWLSATRSERGLTGLWFDEQKHHPGALDVPVSESDPLLRRVDVVLQAYFGGSGLPADLLVELDPQGTPFQQQVWRALLQIAPGCSESYGALAHRIGRPLAVRAVGAAVGRNPVSILIPCHRVLGASGELTGYAGGLARKRAMLNLEGATYKQ